MAIADPDGDEDVNFVAGVGNASPLIRVRFNQGPTCTVAHTARHAQPGRAERGGR
ncbi:hypothetical protein [Hymenobacter sedentarius]|uniref:hypothetical protein n=1 Tax=Hymenobacter sedentarius TaxID=1411621 RepID=UPI0012FE54DB|nr:hypothetical protein [Hymenobacter sedentarius]